MTPGELRCSFGVNELISHFVYKKSSTRLIFIQRYIIYFHVTMSNMKIIYVHKFREKQWQ